MTTILVTGSLGQIGTELIPLLKSKGYTVISTDIRKPTDTTVFDPFEILDSRDKERMRNLVRDYSVDYIIHNASLLSATAEKNPQLAIDINIGGIQNVLEVAREEKIKRVLSPSSIAAFGPNSPKEMTPNDTVMRPNTIYGVSKIYTELLGEYYHQKYDVDFRTLRYPGIISAGAEPGGGTTDWAVQIFYDAILNGKYTCFVDHDVRMPMMSMQDCLKSTIMLLEAPQEVLKHRSFNVSGCNFTPEELTEEIKKYIPDFQIEYAPDFRQDIALSWPKSIDDSVARAEWNWEPDYDIEKLTKYMLDTLKTKLTKQDI